MGDFNDDGKPDLAVTNYSYLYDGAEPSAVSVLLGNGDGTFQAHVDYPISAAFAATDLVVGDFNADSRLDLAVVNAGDYAGNFDGSVGVLLGNGDGTFQAYVEYWTPGLTNSVAVGDFNGDGKLDLVVSNDSVSCDHCGHYDASVSVLLGNGDGTFGTRLDYVLSIHYPMSLTVGDFNGDGKLDVAFANGLNDSSMSVLLGNGDGTFHANMDYAHGQVSLGVTAADFNDDGAADLAFITPGNAVSILLNRRKAASTQLQSSPNPSMMGQPVTLTATVGGPLNGVGMPTGTVTFVEGTQELGSQTLSDTGLATLSIDTLATGTHGIAAVYSGDTSFYPRTSMLLTQVVTDFGVSATPGGATLSAGRSTVFTLTAMAVNGFNGSVSLTCSVSPTHALAPTCALNPASVTPTASGTATAQLSVATTGPTASVMHPTFPHDSSPLYALGLPICSLTLLGVGAAATREKRKKIILGALMAVLMLAFWTACGGSSNNGGHTGSSGTPPGQYTITVNATSGSSVHATAVTITVQ